MKYEGYLSLAVMGGGGPEPYFCNFKCNLKKFGFCKGGPDPLNLPPPSRSAHASYALVELCSNKTFVRPREVTTKNNSTGVFTSQWEHD